MIIHLYCYRQSHIFSIYNSCIYTGVKNLLFVGLIMLKNILLRTKNLIPPKKACTFFMYV